MKEKIAHLISGLSANPEIVTLLLATLPVTELRFSIPYATFVLNMTWQDALIWSMIGNLIPVPIILLFLDPAQKFLSRWEFMEKFFDWLFARTRRRGKLIERFKMIGLALFVSIPLPVTGAWTGSVAAYLFGIRFIPAMISISAGITIAGTIVTLACQGVIGFWDPGSRFTN